MGSEELAGTGADVRRRVDTELHIAAEIRQAGRTALEGAEAVLPGDGSPAEDSGGLTLPSGVTNLIDPGSLEHPAK